MCNKNKVNPALEEHVTKRKLFDDLAAREIMLWSLQPFGPEPLRQRWHDNEGHYRLQRGAWSPSANIADFQRLVLTALQMHPVDEGHIKHAWREAIANEHDLRVLTFWVLEAVLGVEPMQKWAESL